MFKPTQLLVALAGSAMFLSGCQQLGPTAISQGRASYNDSVALTAAEQTLKNMVRAYKNEPIQIVDVTAVNSQSSFQAQLTPTLTASGTSQFLGKTATVGGQLQYSESPTITYTPLQGSSLVNQIASPITVDSIAQLYDSDWHIDAVLTLVADRISVNWDNYFDAIDDISTLDSDGVLLITATKSSATAGGPANAPGSGDDTLLIMCDPSRAREGLVESVTPPLTYKQQAISAWAHFQGLYCTNYIPPTTASASGSVAITTTITGGAQISGSVNITPTTNPASTTQPAPKQTPCGPYPTSQPYDYSVELRTNPTTQPGLSSGQAIPVLRTRSALGMLARATEDDVQSIIFLEPENPLYVGHWVPEQETKQSYISFPLNNSAERPRNLPSATQSAAQSATQSTTQSENSDYRHFICVIHEKGLPLALPNGAKCAYVSTYFDGEWYYISKRDHVSQRNFQLVNLLLSIQAVTPASNGGAPTPTLPVGGGGSGH